ncbi:MAG: hypothetical protein AAGF44_05575 [Pseudomonadota bacterium]
MADGNLRKYLTSLAAERKVLGAFIADPEAAVKKAGLAEEDAKALLARDAGMINARLALDEEDKPSPMLIVSFEDLQRGGGTVGLTLRPLMDPPPLPVAPTYMLTLAPQAGVPNALTLMPQIAPPQIVPPQITPVVAPQIVPLQITPPQVAPTVLPQITPLQVAPTITPQIVPPQVVPPQITPLQIAPTVVPQITPVIAPQVAPTITPQFVPLQVAPPQIAPPQITPLMLVPTVTPTLTFPTLAPTFRPFG